MKAFVYVRVSTAGQEYSPEVQEEQCRLYCQARGIEIAHVFNETAVSGGTPFAERAEGARLLGRVGEVDAIVFSKLDRAFRDTVDCILTVESFREAGKIVHFLDLGVDTSTAAGALCLEMMAAFAKFERRRIADRTREAMAVARARGVKIGVAPFGYENVLEFDASGTRTNRGRWRENEIERAIVDKILELRSWGEGPTQIARLLNEAGVPTRFGGKWSKTHIARILAREGAASC